MSRPWSFLVSWSVTLTASFSLGCGAASSKGEASPDSSTDAGFDANQGFDIGPASDSPFDPDAACAAKSFGGVRVPLAIALVMDESDSMNTSIDTTFSSPSRMTVAKNGVKQALSDPQFNDVAVGLFRFGYTVAGDDCSWDSTPIAAPIPLSLGRAALFNEIDKLKPQGSTPTYDALNSAYAWLAPHVQNKTIPEDGKTIVILVTDGAPSGCNVHDSDEFVNLVTTARAATMDTYIIGIAGADEQTDTGDSTSALMSKLAAIGTDASNLPVGCDTDPSPMTNPVTNPCYFDMSSGVSTDALSSTLATIRQVASSCEYVMPPPDPSYDSSRPGVFITDAAGHRVQLSQCTSPTDFGPSGCWNWTDSTQSRVKIFGVACTTVKQQSAAKVDILLPCQIN